MKRTLLIIAIVLLAVTFRPERGAYAASSGSDEILRAELRLSELGYLAAAPTGRETDAYFAALSAFSNACGLPADGTIPAALFAPDAAPFPPYASEQTFLASGGTAANRNEVLQRLTVDDSYAVTVCQTGVVVHLVCVSNGASIEFRPVGAWDDTALTSVLCTRLTARKIPVLLQLGAEKIACCLTVSLTGSSEANPVYRLLFSGDVSMIGNLPDADAERILRQITA